MIPEEYNLCNFIRARGNLVHKARGLNYYMLVDTFDHAVKRFEQYSLPKLSVVQRNYGFKEYLFCGFAITGSNKIYSCVYVKRLDDGEKAMLVSFWNHMDEGWLLDMGSMIVVLIHRLRLFKIKTLEYRYRSHWKIAPYVKQVFEKFGRCEDVIVNHQFLMEDTKPLTSSPWTNMPIPQGCILEKWGPQSYSELYEAFRNTDLGEGIPPSLSPFQLKDQFTCEHSHLIKYHGKIVGWSLIHTLKPGAVQITSLYVKEKMCKWMGLRTLSKAISECHNETGEYWKGNFLVEANNRKMISFYKKVLSNLGCKELIIRRLRLHI